MPKPQLLNLQFTTVQEPVPEFIYDELQPYIAASNQYHAQPEFLCKMIAEANNVPPGWVFLTSGIDEFIRIAIAEFGTNAHIFTPTEYSTFAQFCPQVRTHNAFDGETYTITTGQLPRASLIWLANPNNPVGWTAPEAIAELARLNPTATIVVDEIYGEYAPELSVVPQLGEIPNLLVCKGFSKSYGLAGIRLGYVLGRSMILNRLRHHTPWANVAYPSCGMAAIALQHSDYFQTLRTAITTRKQTLVDWLQGRGYHVPGSHINTIVLELTDQTAANNLVTQLLAQNILINSAANLDDKVDLPSNYVSFAVGTAEQIEQLKTSLEPLLPPQSKKG